MSIKFAFSQTLVKKPISQAAATFTSLDSVRNLLWLKHNPIINLPVGTTSIDLSNIYTPITIVGDSRPLAGHSWCHGIAVYSTKTGAGVGAVTLSKSGSDLTIACATTNPDFTGWTTSDRVCIVSTAKAATIHNITNIVGNTLTLNPAPPTVNAIPAFVALVPNKTINSAVYLSKGQHIIFQGLFFDSITTDDSINAEAEDCKVELENCLIYNTLFGVAITRGSLKANAETTIVDCDCNLYVQESSFLKLEGTLLSLSSGYACRLDFSSAYIDYMRCLACDEGLAFCNCSSTGYLHHSEFHSSPGALLGFYRCCVGEAENNKFTTSLYGVSSTSYSIVNIAGYTFSGNTYNIGTSESGIIHTT